MEMVGMVITKIRFSGPKSRSANMFFKRPDLDNSLLKDIPREP